MKQNVKVILLIMALFLNAFTIGCVKERADIIDPNLDPQEAKLIKPMGSLQTLGQSNSDLDSASDEMNLTDAQKATKSHYITVGNAGDEQKFTNADSINIENGSVAYVSRYTDENGKEVVEQKSIKVLNLVGVTKTNSPLLNEEKSKLKLQAKPLETYKIVYRATPTHIKVYRVVPSDEVTAHLSSTLIKHNGQDLSVIGGYPVKYYIKDYSKTAEGRNTNVKVYKELSAANYKSASFFKIKEKGFEIFKKVEEEKLDYFPADYFTEGEWYYGSTTVSTKPGLEANIGYVSGTRDSSFEKIATKIRFLQTKNGLRGVNVVTDPRLNLEDEKRDDVFTIPAKWKAYRAQPEGSKEHSLKEEEDDLTDELKREFGLLDLKKSILPGGTAISQISGMSARRNKVIDQHNLNRVLKSFGLSSNLVNMGSINALADKKNEEMNDIAQLISDEHIHSFDNYVQMQTNSSFSHDSHGCLGNSEITYADTRIDAMGESGVMRVPALPENYRLKNINVKENSFSFTILEISTGTVQKYAFERVKKTHDFEPQVLFDKDQTTFGFFDTKKFKFSDYQDRTKRDNEKNMLRTVLNRNKKIVKFKFSTLTPTIEELRKDPHSLNIDYREIGRRVVKYWNRVFELAETGMEFVLVDGDAEVGDLDIHIINIVDSISSTGLYGVGPTISDPETGEVISGTVNMYTRPIKEGAVSKLRNYIRFETGQVSEVGLPKELTKVSPSIYTEIIVKNRCPEVQDFIDNYASTDKEVFLTSTVENKVINSCLEKTLAKELSATLAHEMGHTPVQLRHNFMGEADAENGLETFAKMEQIYPRADFPELYDEYYPDARLLPQANSIMEYPSFIVDFPRLSMPGTYDIAAVAFAYGNKVLKKKKKGQAIGEFVDINHETSLDEQNPNNELGLEHFKYCNDLDDMARLFGPLCAKTVYGKNPIELMDAYFHEYRYLLLFNNRKLDRGFFNPQGSAGRRLSIIGKMGDVYLQWRKKLRTLHGDNNQYLDAIKPELLANESMMAAAEGNKELQSYIGVNDKFFSYMKAISEIPNYYCVMLDDNQKVEVVEFIQLQSDFSRTGNETVNGCLDPNLIDFVKKKDDSNMTIVSEIGYPLNDVKFSSSNDEKAQSADIGGVYLEKLIANIYLYGRIDSMPSAVSSPWLQAIRNAVLTSEKPITPALADEKRFFFPLKAMAEDNILKGLDLTDFINESLEANAEVDINSIEIPRFERYQAEWDLTSMKLRVLVSTLNVPGEGPREVSSHYKLGVTTDANYIGQLQSAGAITDYIPTTNNRFYAAFPESLFVQQAIKRSDNLDSPLVIVEPTNLVVSSNKESVLNYQALNKIRSVINSTIPIKDDSLTSIKYTAVKRLFMAIARGAVTDVQPNGQPVVDANGQLVPVRNLIDDVRKAPKLFKFIGMVNAIMTIEKEVNDAKTNGLASITSKVDGAEVNVAKYDEFFKQVLLDNDFILLASNIYAEDAFSVNRIELLKEVTEALMQGNPDYVAEWNRRMDEKIAGLDSSSEYDKVERSFLSTQILTLLRQLGPVPLR